MTYRVTMIISNGRTVTTCFAGCADEANAKEKAHSCYPIKKIKKVELVKPVKGKYA